MKYESFESFFRAATQEGRFPYQERFATSQDLYELVHAPTGAGKTATAILGWLWRRRFADEQLRASTPRRLVYCLPMRVLVEQTKEAADGWLERLGLHGEIKTHVLMGGEDVQEWDLEPEQDAILIGTQDLLLSRALNRGYGMSRFRWPMHFGLLNNDSLWVLDEIQLMGVGLATSTQLQAFRERLGSYGRVQTIWMSATLLPRWLETVDFRERAGHLRILSLAGEDYEADGLHDRWLGPKPIEPGGVTDKEPDALASLIKDKHLPGSLTLVVVNTVDRSRRVFDALQRAFEPKSPRGRGKKTNQATAPHGATPDLRLIHSRFRPYEREGWMGWLKSTPPPEGRIVVSTQIVEAGVDVSARTLFTELAPWPSLVQRFGRCNRRGEFKNDNPAQVYWIDVAAKDEKQAAPYARSELDSARQRLENLRDAGLKSLHAFFNGLKEQDRDELFPYNPQHVIRRKDFVDLFDTTPDLAGNDIDVSRFIREGDELDVQVFWRSYEPDLEWTKAELRREFPTREELCPVKVGDFREFIEKKDVYRFDPLDGKWRFARTEDVFPGQVFWIRKDQGGYSSLLGWDPGSAWTEGLWIHTPSDETLQTEEPDYDSDLLSAFGWRSIAEHTGEVLDELKRAELTLKSTLIPWAVLRIATHWHDWGKSHRVFQDAVHDGPDMPERPPERRGRSDIAKAPSGFWSRRYKRKHFRHELASALGVLTLLRRGASPREWAEFSPHLQNLALYLIAAHHGKVRLSIRSMPDEEEPEEKLFARGVWDGDELPSMELGRGVEAPAITIELSPMQLGRGDDGSPSWAERMLGLLDHPDFGPLRMAFLEAILRASDMRASKKADEKATVPRG